MPPATGTSYFARLGGQVTQLSFIERRRDLVRNQLIYFVAIPAGAEGTVPCPTNQEVGEARPTEGGADKLPFFILAVPRINTFRQTPETVPGYTADEPIGRWDGGRTPRLDDLTNSLQMPKLMPIAEDRKAIMLTEDEGEDEGDLLAGLLGPAEERAPEQFEPREAPREPASDPRRRPPTLGDEGAPLLRAFGEPPIGLRGSDESPPGRYAPPSRTQPHHGAGRGTPATTGLPAHRGLLDRLGLNAEDVLALMARYGSPPTRWADSSVDRDAPRLRTSAAASEQLRRELYSSPEFIISEFERKLAAEMSMSYGHTEQMPLPRPKAYFEQRCPLGNKFDLIRMLELLDQTYVDLSMGQPKVAQARIALAFGALEQAELDGGWNTAWPLLHLPQPAYRLHTAARGTMPPDAMSGFGGLVNQARLDAAIGSTREQVRAKQSQEAALKAAQDAQKSTARGR